MREDTSFLEKGRWLKGSQRRLPIGRIPFIRKNHLLWNSSISASQLIKEGSVPQRKKSPVWNKQSEGKETKHDCTPSIESYHLLSSFSPAKNPPSGWAETNSSYLFARKPTHAFHSVWVTWSNSVLARNPSCLFLGINQCFPPFRQKPLFQPETNVGWDSHTQKAVKA